MNCEELRPEVEPSQGYQNGTGPEEGCYFVPDCLRNSNRGRETRSRAVRRRDTRNRDIRLGTADGRQGTDT